jgi:glycine oxidase
MDKVLIIGGGVIGLSIARELRKKGIDRITLLERGGIGKESSYAAGGMLAPQSETDKFNDFFYFCRDSLNLYSEFAEQLFDETGVDIELDEAGTLYLAFNEQDLREIRERYEWQKSAGLSVEHLSATEIHKIEPFVSPDVLEGLFFPNDWQVENRKLIEALERFCQLNGVEIAENTEITGLLQQNGKIIGAETISEKFLADRVILATGAWTSLIQTDGFSLPEVKPIRGQMISLQTVKRLFSKVIYSPRGYLIPRRDGRILVGGTSEDVGFDKSATALANEILHEKALEIAPSLVNLEISECWTGLRPFALDGLPVLGEIAENLLIATAHYRNGILLAPVTAKILAEKVADNKENEYFQSFSPNRFQVVQKPAHQ